MKTPFLSALALSVLALPLLLRSEVPSNSSVKFSQPGQPEIVRIFVSQGSVKVQASDVADAVTVTCSGEREEKETRPDGLRVISSGSGFSLTENNNVVEVNYGRNALPSESGADFVVNIPRNASLEVSNGWNTDISVDGVKGDIEIKNLNGPITLKNIGGGALVETMNGEIHADFASVVPGKPLSFTSMNGEIQIRIPTDVKANVRFRTQNGSILTDFPEDVLKTKPEPAAPHANAGEAARIAGDAAREAARVAKEVVREVHDAIRDGNSHNSPAPRPPTPPRPPSIPAIVGGKVVSGTLNGGGTEIQIATMNGDIVVRKIATKP